MGNRVVKFRGKRIDNSEWIYGYYVRHETRQICPIGDDKLKPEEIKHLIIVDSFADWNMPRQLQGIEVIPETVGQYTVLKDKNGVEIYEGDILKSTNKNNVGSIRFWREHASYLISWRDEQGAHLDYADCGMSETLLEIIGNIHDNPGLLEVT